MDQMFTKQLILGTERLTMMYANMWHPDAIPATPRCPTDRWRMLFSSAEAV